MLPDDLQSALTTAARLPRVVLASDFDGTLAPFVENPMDAAPIEGAMDALRDAAGLEGITVALVSGRDVETLGTLAGVTAADPLVLIGSHGAQTTLSDVSSAGLLDDDARRRLSDLDSAVEELTRRHPGSRIERKPAAVALHTRGLPEDVAAAALADAALLGERDGVHPLAGKSVVELGVLRADKGSALLALQQAVGADAVIYLGDDVTDEHAFTALHPEQGDLTIKVGDGTTAAAHRVPGIPEVLEVLRAFVTARTQP